jgi:hypothetical protein
VIRAIAALALASATAQQASTLSTAPWWEKVTVTVNGDGEAGSCRYQSSLQPQRAKSCDVVGEQAAMASSEAGPKDQYTRITFERRFSPGVEPTETALEPGETFLGGQVMSLAINSAGAVKGCRVVAKSGSMIPQYGCDEASGERFEASAAGRAEPRQGYMTILVYAHAEHVV